MMTQNIKLITEKIGGFPEEPHYLVGSKKIYKWTEAFETAQNMCTTPDKNEIWHHLNFKFDVKVKGAEPNESIRELYIERAKQLRKQFDYVRIWTSGGTDSTHTIESFIRAGVAPDELAIYYQFLGSQTTDTNPEVSVALAMYLEEKKIKNIWPNCKIKTYYLFPDQLNWYSRNHIEHFLGTRSVFIFSQCYHNLYECYPTMFNEYKTGSVAEIYSGPDHIDIGLDEHGWFYNFVDKSFNYHFLAPNQRWFHVDPSSPELLLKIAHLGKKTYQKEIGNEPGILNFKFGSQPEMDYFKYDKGIYEFGNKKDNPLYWGLKGFVRLQNLFTSDIGFDSLMCVLSYYKKLQDQCPHWFHQKKLSHNLIGQRSSKVYFEK